MNRGVGVVWTGMLIATVIGVVPAVVGLLMRALTAARNIERYSAEMLTAGVGVATNTANVAALKETLGVAPRLVAGAGSIERHAAAIETALARTGAAEGGQP